MSDAAILPLRNELSALHDDNGHVFAVLDGAQFDNLPVLMLEREIAGQALYLDRGDNDPNQMVTAPYLVPLYTSEVPPPSNPRALSVAALFDLLPISSAAVFWQCTGGQDSLFRHLRGLNMVLYPKSVIPDWVEPESEAESEELPVPPDTHTMVLFRHADANVMAQAMPCLNAAERRRLFGPAESILFLPDRRWNSTGVERHDVPNDAPFTPGTLRLSEATAARMENFRVSAQNARLTRFLRRAFPEVTEGWTDQDFTSFLSDMDTEARRLGVSSEKAFGLMCGLALITKGTIFADEQLPALIDVEPDMTPDQIVQELYRNPARKLPKGAA